MPRIALGLEYDGTAYHGWQLQANAASVEAVVTRALERVADHPLSLICAGRTDAGVHALQQVVHFDTTAQRSGRAWTLGANSNLPPDVRMLWAREVPQHFHARYSAVWREYHYRVLLRPVASALERNRVAWLREPLDLDAMRAAIAPLLGEQDFSSFRGADCQANSPIRRLLYLGIHAAAGQWLFTVRANAFLLHMVRNLVGFLLAVGSGERQAADAAQLLAARDRRLAPPTAPAMGLYLAGVGYPPAFGLPADSIRYHVSGSG